MTKAALLGVSQLILNSLCYLTNEHISRPINVPFDKCHETDCKSLPDLQARMHIHGQVHTHAGLWLPSPGPRKASAKAFLRSWSLCY